MPYSSAGRCRKNGWKVGDVLEGDEGYGIDRIRITAIGDSAILARLIYHNDKPFRNAAESTWDLSCRKWQLVTA